jgi:hypothetical protein
MPRRSPTPRGDPGTRPAADYDGAVPSLKRIALAAGALLSALLYVWFAAVRAVPRVRQARAAARAARRPPAG